VNESITRRSPARAGVIGSLAALPPIGAAWIVASFVLSFYAGATFGGYGAAASGATAGWFTPVIVGLGVVGLVADLAVGRLIRNPRRRRIAREAPA
jgi:hypothetical protein